MYVILTVHLAIIEANEVVWEQKRKEIEETGDHKSSGYWTKLVFNAY